MATIAELASAYRKLRDKKAEIEAEQKLALAPIKSKMEQIEAALMRILNESEADSIKTPDGTVYTTRTMQVSVDDWEEALNYIKDNDLFHMLERRLSKTAVEEFLEAQGHNVPGTHTTFVRNLRVRK